MRVAIVLVALLIVGAVALAGYMAYRPIRAKQLAKQALQDLKDDDLKAARNHIQAANAISPNNIDVARVMAQVWSQVAPSQVVPLWEHAMQLSDNAPEDRVGLAMALLSSGELDKAKDEIDILLDTAGTNPRVQYLNAIWLRAISMNEQSLTQILRLLEAHPEDIRYWTFYASLAPSLDEAGLDSFKKRLDKLGERNDELGQWALRERIRYSDNEDVFDAVSARLRNHKLFTRDDMLFLEAYAHARWNTEYFGIRERVGPYFDPGLAADRKALGRFYRTIGDSRGVLDLITPKQALADKDALMLYLDALAGQQNWDALLEILAMDKLPLERYWREIFRARALASQGNEAEAQLAWKQAISEAGDDSKALVDIAEYLVMIRAVDEFEEVMEKLVANSTLLVRPNMYEMWIETLIYTGDAQRILGVYERALADFPDNKTFLNDTIYYSLLVGKEGDWVIKAYGLAKEAPNVLAYRMTLAFALYKNDQVKEALAIIDGTKLNSWELVSPSWQAIRAAVYKANGKSLKGINVDKLRLMVLPAERSLLK